MKNTTPKKSSSSDPFWEKSESLFLQALFYYVWMEMPPGRKNIVSVLELLAEAKKEKDEPSRLDRRFELLARTLLRLFISPEIRMELIVNAKHMVE